MPKRTVILMGSLSRNYNSDGVIYMILGRERRERKRVLKRG
jgi:hypothetical protein